MAAACTSPDGRKLSLVDPLDDQERRDYETAKLVQDQRQAEEDRLEQLDQNQRTQKLKAIQKENFSLLKTKEFESQLIVQRAKKIIADAHFSTSVRMPDSMQPLRDPAAEKQKLV